MPRINVAALRRHLDSLPIPGNDKFVSTIPADSYIMDYEETVEKAKRTMAEHDIRLEASLRIKQLMA